MKLLMSIFCGAATLAASHCFACACDFNVINQTNMNLKATAKMIDGKFYRFQSEIDKQKTGGYSLSCDTKHGRSRGTLSFDNQCSFYFTCKWNTTIRKAEETLNSFSGSCHPGTGKNWWKIYITQ